MKKLILPLMMLLAFAFASAETYVYSDANDGFVNIRASTSTNSRIIGELVNGGSPAVLMQRSGNWYKVRFGNTVGYVHKSAVILETRDDDDYSDDLYVYSNANDGFLNIRKSPSTNATIIGEIVNGGEGAQFIERSGKWIKVRFHGKVGYVHGSYAIVR